MSSKEVNFRLYCPKCRYYDLKETEDPCNDCLNYGSNEDSHRPVYWKEKEYNNGRNEKTESVH